MAEPGGDVWYACQRCTRCCRWPGMVRLETGEAERIAAYLGLSVEDFVERYTELLPSRRGLTLISHADHRCIFLEGRDCSIQPVKPRQCAGFPNAWNFPGWRDVCEAVPVQRRPAKEAPVVSHENVV